MSNTLSEIMLAAAQASYTVNGSIVSPLPAGYVPGLFGGVYNRHYFVENDLVSRLGGGFLGGQTYMLKNLLGPNVLDPIAAHGLDVVRLLTPGGFLDDLRYTPTALNLPSLQPMTMATTPSSVVPARTPWRVARGMIAISSKRVTAR